MYWTSFHSSRMSLSRLLGQLLVSGAASNLHSSMAGSVCLLLLGHYGTLGSRCIGLGGGGCYLGETLRSAGFCVEFLICVSYRNVAICQNVMVVEKWYMQPFKVIHSCFISNFGSVPVLSKRCTPHWHRRIEDVLLQISRAIHILVEAVIAAWLPATTPWRHQPYHQNDTLHGTVSRDHPGLQQFARVTCH